MRINDLTYAHEIGFFQGNIKEIFNDNRVCKETEQERMIKKLKEEKKKIQPISNIEGQLIEVYNDNRVLKELEQERIIKKLEEEAKKVQPIYNVKGQIIEYDKYGRHLNIKG